MTFRLFQYALPAPPTLDDLNAYLGSHRVAAVERHFVTTAGGAMLIFVVETVGAAPSGGDGEGGGAKVDYRAVLSSEDFELFSRLRAARKIWAEAEGVPVYALFSNAQLAAFAQRRPKTPQEIGAIEGVGGARVEKYSARLLAVVGASRPEASAPSAGGGT